MNIPMFNATMDVYLPNDLAGEWDVLTGSSIDCRLMPLSYRTDQAPARQDRAIEVKHRILLFDANYVLDEAAQIVAEGGRWNVQCGSTTFYRGLRGQIAYRSAQVALVE